VTVIGALGIQILAPEVIVPFAGLFAVGALPTEAVGISQWR